MRADPERPGARETTRGLPALGADRADRGPSAAEALADPGPAVPDLPEVAVSAPAAGDIALITAPMPAAVASPHTLPIVRR